MIVFGVWILGAMANDNIWKFQELVGVGLLCFVFVASIGTVAIIAAADAICRFMELTGDRCRDGGDMKGACLWYGRCLWLQDILLNNLWKRAQIMGKFVACAGEQRKSGKSTKELQLPPVPPQEPPPAGQTEGFVVPPAVANSLLYKYAFAIIFGMIAVVYAMGGSTNGAVVILIVGAVLNAYWLGSEKK